MRVAVTSRRWRRLSALIQLVLFVFSASTPLLPCAYAAGTPGKATSAHHSASMSHESHESHAAALQDSPDSTSPAHHTPASPMSSGTCPWVVGCTGMVQFAFESSWRLLETTPVVAAPVGVTLRPATAERDVESPPPRA